MTMLQQLIASAPGAADLSAILARADEVGDCLIWRGYLANGTPQMRLGGRYVSVRRHIFTLLGNPVPKGRYPVTVCREFGCIHPGHLRQCTHRQMGLLAAQEGKFSAPSRRAAITAARRANAPKLTLALAREIRASTEPGPALAARYGIHRSLVTRIKRGEAWADAVPIASVFTLGRGAA